MFLKVSCIFNDAGFSQSNFSRILVAESDLSVLSCREAESSSNIMSEVPRSGSLT